MTREALIARYRHLTGTVLPDLARAQPAAWPVHADHCFQRIVLDTVCGGVWYDHISRPAYRHMTEDQATRAVALSEDLITGRVDVRALNRASLAHRADRRAAEPRLI